MVAKDIRWIRLLDPENHNISWANHISQTNPGKRDKSDPSFKRQWSRLFHCAALVAPIVLIVSEDGETAFAASCFAVGWNPVNGAFFNGLLRPKNASNAALPPSLLPMLWVTRG